MTRTANCVRSGSALPACRRSPSRIRSSSPSATGCRSLELGAALRLPTFEIEGIVLYKRLALVAEDGRIAKVFYPVFPPDENAADVLDWLRRR